MLNVLVCNITGQETRAALIENGVLSELFIERQSEKGIIGNIYLGKVVRVLPGMQAAFVDIGTDKAAFLYATDVLDEHLPIFLAEEEELDQQESTARSADQPAAPPPQRKARPGFSGRIEELIEEGQEILVQVSKDPIGTKGARITCHISLPGRHLVFMPTVDHVGLSRRINNEKERRRLHDLVEEMRPVGSGFIVRTAAEFESSDHLRRDMRILIRLWQEILQKRAQAKAPFLLHADFDLILRATRDLVTTNIAKIVLDDPGYFLTIPAFINKYMPGFPCHIEWYTGQVPIFEAYGIEIEIERALQRKVWLKSGAYLVIDQTEALTAIDINTGRYVGRTDQEETITKINLEAVGEIAYQLRLRNIGGLIVIDFIDMAHAENREEVFRALAKSLEADKNRTHILKISEFGLVEMTRKRVQDNLLLQMCETCPYCSGRGQVKSTGSVAYEILRRLNWECKNTYENALVVQTQPAVAEYLQKYEGTTLAGFAHLYGREILFETSDSTHREAYTITPKRSL
ncbi:MAG: Rne/Rng family ribonuclease [Bradymonadales bacterium]|nr:Rne/Rng family ribonuclease [Bradymonadales bacterium]